MASPVQTGADLLGGVQAAAPSDSAPPPPPGFVVAPQADDTPPAPPPGFQLLPAGQTGPQRSAGDMLKMGVRSILTGAAALPDAAVNFVNALPNMVSDLATGHPLFTPSGIRTGAQMLSDAARLPVPVSDTEKRNASIIEGLTQGVLTAGAGGLAADAPGAVGMLARGLAANPVADVVSSGAATGAQEVARQNGVGPVGQLAAGFAGGLTGASAVGSLERIATRFGPKAAEIVAEVPVEAAVTPKGDLTDEGRELAASAGLHPDDLTAAYAEHAATPPDAAQTAPDAAAAPVEPQAAPAPAAAPEPVAEAPAPSTTAGRVSQAQDLGVDLTKGQATQDFSTQEAEQTLQGESSPQGNAARQFFAKQQQQIGDAIDRFKSAFGDVTAAADQRGQQVKDALTELRDQGKAGVTALYQQARDAAEKLGEGGQNLIHLDTAPLLAKMREIFLDEAVPDQVRKALKQQAAKYGLIGDSPKTVEGETTVTLRDSSGEPASKVTFTGPPQRLTILNAEDLRQKINQLYEADTSKASQALKPVIDDAVQTAVERAASQQGDVGKAFQTARAAHAAQQQTFKAKDIVQHLIDWKKGTSTPVVLPEHAIRDIFAGGKDSVTNLRKIKAVLLSKNTPNSKSAWQAIQAHGVAEIFDKAVTLNSNIGGQIGTVSGAKLNSAIARFGAEKLKVLLGQDEFNHLMKLRRVIGDATIPISRTVNYSNSAQKVVNFLGDWALKATKSVPGARSVAKGVEEAASHLNAKTTAKGVTDFNAAAAAKADAKVNDPVKISRFLKIAGTDQLLAPIIASAANEDRP